MGGRFKREGIYVYLWLIHVRFDRKQQNSVKQLSFNKNKLINLKKSMPQDLKSSWKAFLLFFFFLLPAGCGNIFPAKSFKVLEEVAISWQEAR